ncbi:DUF6093 family protein [Modestobacter sp. VKM Ac-2985]|uniref:DUF6093 family protein n=1 Tax=Modestobacter sp. VKM Ac-2985 TaxID=3004139 RepID=UPI0022AB7249|nr:DUF6093 family protein [Modestobacter sp. VKM Ac-2985]MCZ2837141.1 DUF6093 family protein [Modestobacter sp. VKM Ac-2985]
MTSPYAAGMAVLTAEVERQMADWCTVTRPADLPPTPVLDSDGYVPAVPAAAVYDGPCTIADPSQALLSNRTIDDQSGVPNQRTVKLPHRAALRPGDLVTVTAAAFSPGLVGDVFVVLGEEERTYATYRRYLLRGSSWVSATTGGSTEPPA